MEINACRLTYDTTEKVPQPFALCFPIEPESIFLANGTTVSLCKLPQGSSSELKKALQHAPHFSTILPFTKISKRKPLRVLFLTDHTEIAQQAAAYLAAIRTEPTFQDNNDWDELDEIVSPICKRHINQNSVDLNKSLLLATSELFSTHETTSNVPAMHSQPFQTGTLFSFYEESPYLFFSSSGEAVLSEEFLDYLSTRKNDAVFVSIQRKQYSRTIFHRLCFEQEFQVCRLDAPSTEYQESVFRSLCQQQHLLLSAHFEFPVVLAHLQQLRGNRFSSYDFVRLINHTVQKFGPKTIFETEHFIKSDELGTQTTALQKLQSLVGLENVKTAVRQLTADAVLSKKRVCAGLPDSARFRNLAFSGAPGTCKSVAARLVAQAMQECGVGSGVFIEVGREQLIGKYMGQTSPMIADLFQHASGGVLFIDEAGALINHSNDIFAVEAVNALVRHMELHPETIVIFASYPQEIDDLLGSNPGLSSRIARVLSFDSYDDDQLCDILNYLANDSQYHLPEGWKELCTDYFRAMRRKQGDRFGNGREARRLLNAAIGNLALRVLEGETDFQSLLLEDVSTAVSSLLGEGRLERPRIGF